MAEADHRHDDEQTMTGVTNRRLLAVALLLAVAGCGRPQEPLEQPPEGTGVGERAPALVGEAATGDAFVLGELPGMPTVLVFYRGAQCGLCRVQLEQMQQHLGAYRRQGTRIIALTLDPPEMSRVLSEQMQLGFELISVDSATFVAWGGIDRESGSPLPATFILDSERVVRFRHIGRNAADRTTDPELLTLLEQIAAT
jgi:peroxiredoxin